MTATLEITILGCGSSGGVPRVGGDWGACDPQEPRNRRTRCSILVDYWEGEGDVPREERTSVLVDTSPDLREQLLKSNVKRLDAVLYTHEHADQTHGIDDLRAIAYKMRGRIPVYTNAYTSRFLKERFGYCFEKPEGRIHPPILDLQDNVMANERLSVDGPGGKLDIDVLALSHGPTPVLGFRFAGQAVYTPDVHEIDAETLTSINGPSVWIMDALRYSPSPAHAHVDKALSWAATTQTRKIIFTNMHLDLDYGTLQSELPSQHEVGFDGMRIGLHI